MCHEICFSLHCGSCSSEEHSTDWSKDTSAHSNTRGMLQIWAFRHRRSKANKRWRGRKGVERERWRAGESRREGKSKGEKLGWRERGWRESGCEERVKEDGKQERKRGWKDRDWESSGRDAWGERSRHVYAITTEWISSPGQQHTHRQLFTWQYTPWKCTVWIFEGWVYQLPVLRLLSHRAYHLQ